MELSQKSWMLFLILLTVMTLLGWLIFLLELNLLNISKRLGEGKWGAKRWFWDSVWKSLLLILILTALGFFLADKPDAAEFVQEEDPERAYCVQWLAEITVVWVMAVGLLTLSVVWSYGSLIVGFLFKQLPVQKRKALGLENETSMSQNGETPMTPRSGLTQAVSISQDLEQIPRIPHDHEAPKKGEPEPLSAVLGQKKATFEYDKKYYEQLLTTVICFSLIPVFGIAYSIYQMIASYHSQSMLILCLFVTCFLPPLVMYLISRPRLLSIEIFEKGIRGNERSGSNDFPWDKIRFIKMSEFEQNEKTYSCVVVRRDDNLELTAVSRTMADVDKLWEVLIKIAEEHDIRIVESEKGIPVLESNELEKHFRSIVDE